MTDPKTKLFLQDMLANARIARDLIRDRTLQEFTTNITLLYAVTRAVEIVGEAAAQVDSAASNSLPTLPWRQATTMRNRLIHGYRTVDAETVFETVRANFPPLIAELERILISHG